jgi:hypothetical protein
MKWRRKPGQRPTWLNSDNSVDLLVPVTYHIGDERNQMVKVKLRRLTAKERRMMDGPGLATDIVLEVVAAMTGDPVSLLERIDSVDLDRIEDVLGFFMEPGSVTSPT